MSRPAKTWQVIEAIATGDAREAIQFGLMEAGANGTETTEDSDGPIAVRGYFNAGTSVEAVRAALFEALRIYNLPLTSLDDLKVSEVVDRDWLAEWKKDWRPVEVGRFIIAPPWIESLTTAIAKGISPDPIVIRIEPGMAFGTGTHETTRLCLRAIERHFRGGSFLDVGTGTGILAMAAATLFPGARISARDTDADAVAIARENARLNGLADRIEFSVGSIDEQTPSADLICANLTAPVIVDLLPLLIGASCGRLVLSGILDSQLDLVRSRLLELGTAAFETNQEGEWIALVV